MRREAEPCRSNRFVSLAHCWEAILSRDSERKQDMAGARATCAVMEEDHGGLGNRFEHFPLSSGAERAAFVLERVRGGPARG